MKVVENENTGTVHEYLKDQEHDPGVVTLCKVRLPNSPKEGKASDISCRNCREQRILRGVGA